MRGCHHSTERGLHGSAILLTMADGSLRPRRSTAGPLVVAVIFLGVLGAGAGFSLGTLARDAHVSTSSTHGTPPATPPAQAGGTDQTPADNGNQNSPSAPASSQSTGSPADSTHCPQHTIDLARSGSLTLLLYLHTGKSEVWVCKSGDGTLFYQGHLGQPGGSLKEGKTALFLTTIAPEGSGYVATNTDPSNGHVTKYHVTSDQLVIEYTWSGDHDTQPAI
jgi:hypothetical protein